MGEAKRAILLDGADSVAVAVDPLAPGDRPSVSGAGSPPCPAALEAVPAGHKIALRDVEAGGAVLKYGRPIGRASARIPAGSWVHSHNLSTALAGRQDYEASPPYEWPGRAGAEALLRSSGLGPSFRGYRRPDGRAGVRDELWVIPTVGCINGSAERFARMAREEFGIPALALTHPYGCSQLGGDLDATRRLLARLAAHPNAGATLVLSLGCENNTLPEFKRELGPFDPERVGFIELQKVDDEEAAARDFIARAAPAFASRRREELPLALLSIGVKCGGSDGYSGITANPVVGRASELLAAAGGSILQTEVPEMFGAETVLMARAADRAAFEGTVRLVNSFKDYFESHGQPVYENPSSGNKEGGITTLEEKSLGCIRKSGALPVAEVLGYGEAARAKGLSLLYAPGNDLVSSTALVAAGAQLVLFTTGRGTPYGTAAPTLKIATNGELARRKPGWIDFDAGRLLEGASLDELAVELLGLAIATAEGRPARAEQNGYREIAIFKDGVTL